MEFVIAGKIVLVTVTGIWIIKKFVYPYFYSPNWYRANKLFSRRSEGASTMKVLKEKINKKGN